MQNPLTRSLGLAREYTKIADSSHALERIEIVISIIFFYSFYLQSRLGQSQSMVLFSASAHISLRSAVTFWLLPILSTLTKCGTRSVTS